MGVIYAHFDPRHQRESFGSYEDYCRAALGYVGATVNAEQRLKQHIAEAKPGENRHHHWLSCLLQVDLSPLQIILEELDDSQLAERENWWIAHFLDIGCRLTNRTRKGGYGGKAPSTKCSRLFRTVYPPLYEGPPKRPAPVDPILAAARARYQELRDRLHKADGAWANGHLPPWTYTDGQGERRLGEMLSLMPEIELVRREIYQIENPGPLPKNWDRLRNRAYEAELVYIKTKVKYRTFVQDRSAAARIWP